MSEALDLLNPAGLSGSECVLLGLFLLAGLAPVLFARFSRVTTALCISGPSLGALYFMRLALSPWPGPSVCRPWAAEVGISLCWALDGLSVFFAVLICAMGAGIVFYASDYLRGRTDLGRFYGLLLLFMASMLGLVLSDNLMALFIFWELTSVSSFFLIGFSHHRPEARAAARQALLVTAGGGMALVFGFLLLSTAGQSWQISDLIARAPQIQSHAYFFPALVFVFVGAATKSALFPFHFWLPGAMQAPSPVSAYLHSATMVKAGVYLLARLQPVLGGNEPWSLLLGVGGALTVVTGAWLSLLQSDLKAILAYSTVAALGMLVLMLGFPHPALQHGFIAFLLAHALYKGAAFLVAGNIEAATGTRDIEKLSGLRKGLPWTFAGAVLSAASMAGVPGFFGFLAKETLYEPLLARVAPAWVLGTVVAGSAAFIAVAGMFGITPFRAGPPGPKAGQVGGVLEVGWRSASVPILLGVLGVVFTFSSGWVSTTWLLPVVTAMQSGASSKLPLPPPLALWHGWTLALGLSAITFLIGVGLWGARARLNRWASPLQGLRAWGPQAAYDWLLNGLESLAAWQTNALQSHNLRRYLHWILTTTVALCAYAVVRQGLPLQVGLEWDFHFYEATVVLMIVLGAFTVARSASPFSAIAALGVVGFGVAMVYVFFGAPDLAMTQILVETLTVILFVLVFYHLPDQSPPSTQRSRITDGILATLVGGLMAGLVLLNAGHAPSRRVAGYFLKHSLELGKGSNVVNVILVDFRGLDTLGEIAVLAVASVGVYALLKLRPSARQKP